MIDALDPDETEVTRYDIGTTLHEYFAFRLGDNTYALRAMDVERVAPMQRIVPVPTSPAHVRGVIHLAGRILAVIDLATLLGIDTGTSEPQRIVVVGARTYTFGIVVDAALGMWAITAAPRDGMIEGPHDVVAAVLDLGTLLERVL